jgi:HPt (histidine-containing phosphotransfer) domain-containing protein
MAADGAEKAVDFAYLEGFAAGDAGLVGEVLAIFQQQAAAWAACLVDDPAGWPDVVHTIKGAARGIGANRLGDICAEAEAKGPSGLPAVRLALAEATADIAAYLGRSQ